MFPSEQREHTQMGAGDTDDREELLRQLRDREAMEAAAWDKCEAYRLALAEIAASAGEGGRLGTSGDGHARAIATAKRALGVP